MLDESVLRLMMSAFQHPSFIGTGAGAGLALMLGKLRRHVYFWVSILAIAALVQIMLVAGSVYTTPLLVQACEPDCSSKAFLVLVPVSAVVGLLAAFGLGALRVWMAPRVERDLSEPFR